MPEYIKLIDEAGPVYLERKTIKGFAYENTSHKRTTVFLDLRGANYVTVLTTVEEIAELLAEGEAHWRISELVEVGDRVEIRSKGRFHVGIVANIDRHGVAITTCEECFDPNVVTITKLIPEGTA